MPTIVDYTPTEMPNFHSLRPGLWTNGEWTIERTKKGWQLYGCNAWHVERGIGWAFTWGHAWYYLRDAKEHAKYRWSFNGRRQA